MTARAVLRLDLEGAADIVRAFGTIQGAVRSGQAAMNAETRRGTQERTRAVTAEGRAVAAVAQASVRERARAERDASRVVAAEARKREQSARASAKEREKAEKLVTKTTEAEAKKRVKAEGAWAKEVDSIHKNLANARERAERQATRTAEQESKRRTRVAETERATIGRGLMHVGRAGMQYATQMHGEIQDSRHRRADSEHTINAALYQANIGVDEAAGMRQQIYARAAHLGVDSGEFAESLLRAQTRFSILTSRDPRERQRGLAEQLDLAEFAQNTYQDPAEVMEAAGMLRQQGLSQTERRSVLTQMTGMAHYGSVNLHTMISQGLGPLMQNIAARTNANMTPEQRAAAVRDTTLETMAVGEIGAAGGMTPRLALNALSKFRLGFQSARDAEHMHASLTSRVGAAQANEMVERYRDARGHQAYRFRSNNTVENLTTLNRLMGGDTAAGLNMLRAGGHGTPTVFTADMRRLYSTLNSQNAAGQTTQSRVEEMLAAGREFGQHDIDRGRVMVQGEQHTAITRAQEEHDTTLTDNTSALVGLSNSIRDWSVRNPWASGAGSAVSSLAGAAAPSLLMATGAPGALSRALPALAGAVPVAAGAGAGATMGVGVGGFLAGLGIGEGINRLAYSDRDRAQSSTGGDTSILSGTTWSGAAQGITDLFTGGIGGGGRNVGHGPPPPPTAAAIGAHVARALRENPPTAVVSPHDAAHAASANASGRNPTPPERR